MQVSNEPVLNVLLLLLGIDSVASSVLLLDRTVPVLAPHLPRGMSLSMTSRWTSSRSVSDDV